MESSTIKPQAKVSRVSSAALMGREIGEKSKASIQRNPGEGIKKQLFNIASFLKGTLAQKKVDEKKKRDLEKRKTRSAAEKKLEQDPPDAKRAGLQLPKLKAPSFLQRIQRFFFAVLAGFVAVRLVEFVPKLEKILPTLSKTFDFISNTLLGLVDGLGSFFKLFSDANDSVKEYLGEKFGEDSVKRFEELVDATFNLINAFLIVSAGKKAMGFDGTKKPTATKPGPKPKTVKERAKNIKKIRDQRIKAEKAQTAKRTVKAKVNRMLGRQGRTAVKGVQSRAGQVAQGVRSTAAKVTTPVKNLGAKASKLIPKGALKAIAKPFSKIPIMGPLILAVSSLLAGEPIGQALFKGVGAALGGLLGTAIPIPVIGTLLGETIGVFVGDLLYELTMGGGPEAAGKKLQDTLKTITEMGTLAIDWAKEGFERFYSGVPKFKLPDNFLLGPLSGIEIPDAGFILNPIKTAPLAVKAFFGRDPITPPGQEPDKSETKSAAKSESKPTPPDTPYPKGKPGEGVLGTSSSIVSIGKELIKQQFSVAEHPDFTKTPKPSGGTYTPGKGTVSNVHKGEGHYDGRAIDVTNWRGGDPAYKKAYLPVLDSLQKNPAVKMLIHDTWGFYKDGKRSGPGSYGHSQHMHIETKDKGGKIGKGLFANMGGTEFVIDADSTAALEGTFPGFLQAINRADGAEALNVLRSYASYDQEDVQIIQVPVPMPGKSSSGIMPIPIGGKQPDLMMDELYAG
jgi:hypothetical protein